jgi:HK97 family phage portal protein
MGSAATARDRLGVALAVDRAVRGALPAVRAQRDDGFADVDSSDRIRMGQIFGGHITDSGAVVNEHTAMRVSAVYRCVALIAGSISTTPCTFYRRDDQDGREKADHPYWWLFNEQPTARFSAATFWEFVTAQMLLRGDGIAYLVRESRFSPRIREVIPVPRGNVSIKRHGDRLRYTITDEMADGSIGSFTVDQDDVLHFPGLGFDGVCSQSVIGWAARQAIGIAIKADEHAANTFAGGASIQYAVKAPKMMTPKQQEDFRDAWVAKYGSGNGHSKIPLVLTEGLDITELSMTSVDAQLLDSRKFQVVDIARAFGVPPHMIGETSAATSWGTGIEQMSLGYVRYTLRSHLRRYQQEMNRKLFPRIDRYFVEFNVDSLLEGDSKAQAEYFAKALGGPGAQGWMTVNEVRALKNMKRLPGCDTLQLSTTPAQPAPPADGESDATEKPSESPAGA